MDKSDPFGLYRALELSPSATGDEIEAAAGNLYYIPMGTEAGIDLAETFRRSSEALRRAREAFDILNDPARKANYDWFARNLPEADEETDWADTFDLRTIVDGPTHCSCCGSVTPLPRYVAISQVTGTLYTSARTTAGEGLFCADCAKSFVHKSALVTLLFGFLSKGGPLWATWSWLKNGHRGHHLKLTDERLALHNARAYLARGEVKLAYALARISAASADDDIARQAVSIMLTVEAAGGDYWNYTLADPWAVPTKEKILFVVLPFVISTAIVVAVFIYGELHRGEANRFRSVNIARPQFCVHPPEHKTFLTPQTEARGDLTLRIWNTSLQDAVVKVRDRTAAVVASVFLKRDDSLDISGLPSDDYKIQFQLGYHLDETCKVFANYSGIFEKSDSSKTVFDGGKIIEYRLVTFGSVNRPLFDADFLKP